MSQPDHNRQVELAARELSVAYGKETILDNLGFAAIPGAFTVLVGANGSGKSTLLRTLAGLLAPSKGGVLLDGRAISLMPGKSLARQVGLLAQGPIAHSCLVEVEPLLDALPPVTAFEQPATV